MISGTPVIKIAYISNYLLIFEEAGEIAFELQNDCAAKYMSYNIHVLHKKIVLQNDCATKCLCYYMPLEQNDCASK